MYSLSGFRGWEISVIVYFGIFAGEWISTSLNSKEKVESLDKVVYLYFSLWMCTWMLHIIWWSILKNKRLRFYLFLVHIIVVLINSTLQHYLKKGDVLSSVSSLWLNGEGQDQESKQILLDFEYIKLPIELLI